MQNNERLVERALELVTVYVAGREQLSTRDISFHEFMNS